MSRSMLKACMALGVFGVVTSVVVLAIPGHSLARYALAAIAGVLGLVSVTTGLASLRRSS